MTKLKGVTVEIERIVPKNKEKYRKQVYVFLNCDLETEKNWIQKFEK